MHCHSTFSLLDGASSPEALVERAAALGQRALALTDHDDLGGIVRFGQAATEAGIDGIIGAELTLWVPDAHGAPSPTHLVLLAEDRTGYGNLSVLITHGRLHRPRGEPGVGVEELAAHAEGLIALTGCPRGWLPSRVQAGDEAGARRAADTLREIFGDRLAIECWDHGLPEERALVAELLPIARRLGVPWVVTNDVHYATPDARVAHDVLCALRHERTLDDMGTRLRPNAEWYLKSARQLRRRWRHDDAGLRATVAIAERCTFRLADLQPTLPSFPLPPGVTADEYLEALVEEGARWRWPGTAGTGDWGLGTGNGGNRKWETGNRSRGKDSTPQSHFPFPVSHFQRPGEQSASVHSPVPSPQSPVPSVAHATQLAHELSLIRRLGLAGYFLIVWDIVRFARREGILCQGRGSAANSAVCYCLGITAVDPVRLGLLFERFLSEERREAPDIDIDFAHRDRERVLQYVYERYGREHAAMVCEHITWRGRSAVRDAARVLGFSVEQANALSTYSDRFSARATADALRAGLDPVEANDASSDTSRDAPDERDGRARRDARNGIVHGRSGDDAPGHVRRDADKRAIALETRIADAVGSSLMTGTNGTNLANAVKAEARRMKPATQSPIPSPQSPIFRPRPKPRASYEPSGSPSAQDSGATRSRDVPGWVKPAWMDPHADCDHVERRNPTTALRDAPGKAREDSVLARAGLDPRDRRVRLLADIVEQLHQAPRHRSIHVGGFVLTREPLSTVVPIEPASMPDRTVIQWEKDDLDPAGLIKIDLLGLGMLTLLQDCIKYIHLTRGVDIDIGALDMADPAVYDDLCRADTIGVFQVESRAQMNTLPRLKPRSFYDLVIEVALIRPGPIQGDMVHPFLRRRAGVEAVTYPHPALEPILKRTLGVPLFQEQGMQVAIACAGFTPGEADELRRAMGHKRSRERMAGICERLVQGMAQNGIAEETARKIYNQINAFADYGFPESHAASFALLVYASAYLKHHYAPEFTAALLNAQPMGFYAPGTIIEDARRHGVEVRPVDLTRSGWDHSLEVDGRVWVMPCDGVMRIVRDLPKDGNGKWEMGNGGAGDATSPRAPVSHFPFPISALSEPQAPALRLGLRSIRGLGAAAREKLEGALEAGGFTSVHDVVERTQLDRRALRLLAEAGAFDAFFADVPLHARRRTALWHVLEAQRGAAGPLAPLRPRPTTPPLPPMHPAELTQADYRLTAMSLNGHPMQHVRPLLAPNGIRTARELQGARDGEQVALAGLVICRQRPGTAKGFVFLTLEDETGCLNVVVTPKRFEQQAVLISTAPLLIVRGTLQVESNVVNLRGRSFHALDADVGAEHAKSHDFH